MPMTNGVDCILGSGPAAVACAHELIKAGRIVVMIDPHRKSSADSVAQAKTFRENPEPENFVKRMRDMRRKLPSEYLSKKLPFSSPHVYDAVDQFLPAKTQNAVLTRSLATGGLSSVWGATAMPFSARSFRDWPVTLDEMAPFYRSVADIMDVPSPHDDLEKIYANYGKAEPLVLSEQGAQLMSNLVNNRKRLTDGGIMFGRCRSAVGASYAANKEGCVYCGLCMYGCPYRVIFSAEYVIEQLKSNTNFEHKIDQIAVGFEEKADGVSVHLCHLDRSINETLECERLFVACGASTSLRLVADALKWFDHTFYLMDTQLVTIPALLRYRSRVGAVPQANALGQVFAELDMPEICDELIHLQVYGFNPFIVDLLHARWGVIAESRMLQPFFDRLMMIMAYLPGQISGKVALKVTANTSQKSVPPVICIGEINPRTATAVERIKAKLRAHRKDFGWSPLTGFAETPEPGASHHLAGGLPMRALPGVYESDRLGRPYGLNRVHVVDAANFSSLPGEHLTYTIMANAARIAAQSCQEKAS